jgi:hypothetical protein
MVCTPKTDHAVGIQGANTGNKSIKTNASWQSYLIKSIKTNASWQSYLIKSIKTDARCKLLICTSVYPPLSTAVVTCTFHLRYLRFSLCDCVDDDMYDSLFQWCNKKCSHIILNMFLTVKVCLVQFTTTSVFFLLFLK